LKTQAVQKLSSFAAAFLSLAVLLIFTSTKPVPKMSAYSLLCLGDSYTIGEKVPPNENFPEQTIQLLKKDGVDFENPEVIAKTGWTTDELQDAIHAHTFKPAYDFVTLLVGVNNQYRGRSVGNYKPEFESLLKQAIRFAGGKADHVFVLSIPDWGVTPFAKGRDTKKITAEIDDYNAANKEIASNYKVHYIDITPGTREAIHDLSLLAEDGLHPSGKEYAKWAVKLADKIRPVL
jgi:lysophospholipase L1-like esterase